MKLDATVMRTMDRSDFRLLEAVETGMKDHYIVPMAMIAAHAGLRHGGTQKVLRSLLRDKLLSHEKKGGLDGFRLTNSGYDILALHELKQRQIIVALGPKIGTGKESDVYLAATPNGKQIVLKFHRLGRTSFRNVKQKRDYIRPARTGIQNQHSWLFLSKLSALKEFSFLSALHKVHYPTPEPIAHNRHIIAMSLVRGTPLYQVYPKQVSLHQAEDIYRQVLAIAARLASTHGLVHCDLNEFNLLVDLSGIQSLATDDRHDAYVRHSGYSVVDPTSVRSEGILSKPAWEQSLMEQNEAATVEQLPEPRERLANGEPKPIVTLIDFPQMISTQHPNAQELFERDMACLKRFFESKLKCQLPEADEARWEHIVQMMNGRNGNDDTVRLDQKLHASGISLQDNQQLELYYYESGLKPIASAILEETVEDDDEESSSGDQKEEDDPALDDDDHNSQERHDKNSLHLHTDVMIDTSAADASL